MIHHTEIIHARNVRNKFSFRIQFAHVYKNVDGITYMQTVYENIRKKSILKKLAKSERGRLSQRPESQCLRSPCYWHIIKYYISSANTLSNNMLQKCTFFINSLFISCSEKHHLWFILTTISLSFLPVLLISKCKCIQ